MDAAAADPGPRFVTTLEALEQLFATPPAANALRKEVDHLHPVYQRWIEAAPFVVLATCGDDGLDASPRGDPAGFVAVQDAKTLLLPERRGNNRIDSLRNIVRDPRVGMLFLVPGVGETLRVNGRARIRVDDAVLRRFAMAGQLPKCVLEISVEAVYFQCAKAIVRSKLWNAASEQRQPPVPTAGEMLAAVTAGGVDGAAYDAALPDRQRTTLY